LRSLRQHVYIRKLQQYKKADNETKNINLIAKKPDFFNIFYI